MSCKIILVDDNSENRDVLSRILGRLGAETVSLTRGEEVISMMAQERKVDLIILDYHLPGLNGEEIAKNLRTFTWCPPLVCLTGDYVQQSDIFDYYLLKPVRLANLQELLRRTCFSSP